MKITPTIIKEVTDRLVKTYNPLEIYLFGSYAWGKPTEESDLDLMVIVEKSKEKSYKRSRKGSKSLRSFILPYEIHVFTRAEFDARAKDVSTLCYKIKEEGKRIYAQS